MATLTDPKEIAEWLDCHIPHRVRACLAITPYLEREIGSLPNWKLESREDAIARRCETDAIWEARIIGMRWLIEFVGLTEDKNQTPIARKDPDPQRPRQFLISQLGAPLINPSSPEAKALARIWKGGSQGTGHPTYKSGHPSVEMPELMAALEVIIAYLDKTVYASRPEKVLATALKPAKEYAGLPSRKTF